MILNKLLPLLLSPLFLLVLVAVLALWFRRRGLAVTTLAVLWLCSLPVVADSLWRSIEQHALRPSVATAPTAQAVVVLGGMTWDIRGEQGMETEWNENADRFWAGLDLYKAGKAPRLFLMAGRLPWEKNLKTEGHWLREKAVEFGVPSENIWLSPEVQNTFQEAQAVAKELPGGTILLVTSAFHMPRARAVFEAQGLTVLPFPVDFRVVENETTVLDFLPNPGALETTTSAMRELLGRAYYSLR
ncbi:MAG: YdcF family protein [Burkholderiaceae bacterium]